jgi:hypothetical protein
MVNRDGKVEDNKQKVEQCIDDCHSGTAKTRHARVKCHSGNASLKPMTSMRTRRTAALDSPSIVAVYLAFVCIRNASRGNRP